MRKQSGRAHLELMRTLTLALTRLEKLESNTHSIHLKLAQEAKAECHIVLSQIRRDHQLGRTSWGEDLTLVQTWRLLDAVQKLTGGALRAQRQQAPDFSRLLTQQAGTGGGGRGAEMAFGVAGGLAHWTHASHLHHTIGEMRPTACESKADGGSGRGEWQEFVSRSKGRPFWSANPQTLNPQPSTLKTLHP